MHTSEHFKQSCQEKLQIISFQNVNCAIWQNIITIFNEINMFVNRCLCMWLSTGHRKELQLITRTREQTFILTNISQWKFFWFKTVSKSETVFKYTLIRLLKHSQIRYWNKPVLSNECEVYCSRKQRFVPGRVWPTRSAILKLLVRRFKHSTTPSIFFACSIYLLHRLLTLHKPIL
jgi:hypothetical protein